MVNSSQWAGLPVGRLYLLGTSSFSQYKSLKFAYIWFSCNPVMAELGYFSNVPREIICMIVNYLSESDMITLNLGAPGLFIEHK